MSIFLSFRIEKKMYFINLKLGIDSTSFDFYLFGLDTVLMVSLI